MFAECKSLSNLKPLEKWNVSKGACFRKMFYNISDNKEVSELSLKWKISNEEELKGSMFSEIVPKTKMK